MKKIIVIHGPNLNLLGKREPDTYGRVTFDELNSMLRKAALKAGVELGIAQSNHEGEIVDIIQKADGNFEAIIINPGAYTHTSIAIRDAIAAVGIPTVEVHISNIYKREDFRHKSYISEVAAGVRFGFWDKQLHARHPTAPADRRRRAAHGVVLRPEDRRPAAVHRGQGCGGVSGVVSAPGPERGHGQATAHQQMRRRPAAPITGQRRALRPGSLRPALRPARTRPAIDRHRQRPRKEARRSSRWPAELAVPLLSLWKHGTDYEPRAAASPVLVLTPA